MEVCARSHIDSGNTKIIFSLSLYFSSVPLKERNQSYWLPSFLSASYLPTRWTAPMGHLFIV